MQLDGTHELLQALTCLGTRFLAGFGILGLVSTRGGTTSLFAYPLEMEGVNTDLQRLPTTTGNKTRRDKQQI